MTDRPPLATAAAQEGPPPLEPGGAEPLPVEIAPPAELDLSEYEPV